MSEVVWYTSFFMIVNFAPFSIESKYLFAMAGSFSADSLFFPSLHCMKNKNERTKCQTLKSVLLACVHRVYLLILCCSHEKSISFTPFVRNI